jgi:SAM-dependent methyltransferase
MLSPHPQPEDLAGFYPPVYSFAPDVRRAGRFKRLVAAVEYQLFYRVMYSAQVRRVLRTTGWQRRAGQRLLEVGCGRGLRLLGFRGHGLEVHGMDFQPEVVAYVRDRLGIPAVCTDVAGLKQSFAPASFDFVVAYYVLEHVPDVRAVIASCRQLLRPGGWLVAAVPLVDSVQARLFRGRWLNVAEAPRHLSLPTHEAMVRAFKDTGFGSVIVRPDALIGCATLIGLSVCPGAATTFAYTGSRLGPMLLRPAAALISLLALPWTLVENYVLELPAVGLFFAQKPAGSSADGRAS